MPWPTPQDYNEAVQNPRFAFGDPELQSGQPELTPLGLPRPISGNFACVYKIQSGGQRWAARCFISEVSDLQRRYEAISAYLAKAALPYTVPFTYLPTGIRVQGRVYPLLRMQWVHGESLHTFVGRHLRYPDTLLSLTRVWSRMMADLKAAQIAHGDLQHGNVLVVGDQLRLLDYDGMFVPALAGQRSNECGHRNYQLPTRSGWDYGPYLDNFSAWVIYVSLVALAVHPELWTAHRGGDECLIFRKEDFVRPENSALISDLSASSNAQLRMLLELFTSFLGLSPQDVPSLDGSLPTVTIDAPSHFSSQRSNSDWWSDHVKTTDPREEARQTDADRSLVGEPVAHDPSWIIDSLMDEKPVEALVFQGSAKEIRLVVLGSLALVVLTSLLVDMPATELFVVSSYVLGLNLLICYIRYKRNPVLAEFETFKKESRAFLKKIQEHQTMVNSITAERQLLQESLAKGEREIEDHKLLLHASCQSELNRMLTLFNAGLQGINQRRKEIASSETKKLNEIIGMQGSLGIQIGAIVLKLQSLAASETWEKHEALKVKQKTFIETYLRGSWIAQAKIRGIGPALIGRLATEGITTALDVEKWKILRIPGIGHFKAEAIQDWRDGVEAEAKHKAPSSISGFETGNIESKYRLERQNLQAEKVRLESQMNNQIEGVRQYFAGIRQSLQQEEQQLRAADVRDKALIEARHDAELASLDKKAVLARSQASPILQELSRKLQDAQKSMFAIRWQSTKREKQGRRFARLRFRDYLHKVMAP